MPLGDNDLAAGVFTKDFGRVVSYGGQTVKGNFDAPAKDAGFGNAKVSDVDYRLELPQVALAPFPTVGDAVTVDGVAYKVRSADPMDDGAIVELCLRLA
jgi:hypothetical protein